MAPQTEGMSVGRSRETGRKPRSYFPRSFTISKKHPGLGENISRMPRVGERGLDGGAEHQNKFPTAGKGEAGRAEAAAPCGPKRIARGSGRAGFLLSFASVLPLLRFRAQQILFLDWIEKGACLHGRTHRLHTFAEQSCEGPAGPGWGAEGRWEAGEGRGRRAGPRAPRDSGRREVRGGCPFWPSRVLSSPFLSLFFYCCRSILPEVDSTVKASSSPSMAPVRESQPPRGSRRCRLVFPQL